MIIISKNLPPWMIKNCKNRLKFKHQNWRVKTNRHIKSNQQLSKDIYCNSEGFTNRLHTLVENSLLIYSFVGLRPQSPSFAFDFTCSEYSYEAHFLFTYLHLTSSSCAKNSFLSLLWQNWKMFIISVYLPFYYIIDSESLTDWYNF